MNKEFAGAENRAEFLTKEEEDGERYACGEMFQNDIIVILETPTVEMQ